MKRLRDWVHSDSDLMPKMEILREKMERLTAREIDVHTEIENAEIQPGIRRRQEVVHWLATVGVKRSKVHIIEKESQDQPRSISSKSELIGHIDRATKDVQELIEQGKFTYGPVLSDRKSRSLPFQLTPLAGKMLNQNGETIMEWLKNPQQYFIGVQGMGGVGKTTLLKHVYNQIRLDPNMAGRVYWVTVSQDCTLYNLQHKIACAVGVNLSKEDDEDRRAAKLHDSLSRMGKTVLFLDDMWDWFMVDKTGIPHVENSFKIILSTRSVEVCRSMGCEKFVVQVKPLSIDEAWKLFVDRLQNYEALASEVKQIASLVANECGCLPLATITIAVCMRGVFDMEEWHNALDELRNTNVGHHDMENYVLRILKFSYDRLNSEILKGCFLSCALFPEDHMIEREELIELWIMEGLLDGVGSRSQQLNKGHTILNKLENLFLLESCTKCEKKSVRMHDLIRDMAILISKDCPRFIAKAGLHLTKVPGGQEWTKDLIKVSVSRNNICDIPCGMSPETPNLKVLILNDNPLRRIPESFFEHMKALTVLNLSGTCIQRLPASFCNLENLRALLLGDCKELMYVPSVEKLTKLRVLNLPDNKKLEEAPRGLERLMCMEMLSNCLWKVSDVTGFNSVMKSWGFFTSRCYQFWLYDVKRKSSLFTVDSEYYKCERSVYILAEEFVEEPYPLLPLTVEWLKVSGMKIKEMRSLADVLPSFADLTELKVLRLVNCEGLECISRSSAEQQDSICPELETLELLELSGLQELRRITKSEGCSFSHLKHLNIGFCTKMKVGLPLKSPHHMQPLLPNLEQITVFFCQEMEEIFESNSNSSSFQTVDNDISGTIPNPILALPNLREVCLRKLPKLRSIYHGLLVCASLEHVWIEECPKVELVPLSKPLICDASPSTLASIPIRDPNWWAPLNSEFPEDVCRLSQFINQLPVQTSATHND